MEIVEEEINIKLPDGTSDGFLYRANDGRPHPGIIQLTDIGGIRPSQREMARRIASEGYSVLLPNVFFRTARPPVFDIAGPPGDEKRLKRMAELTAPLTPEVIERDASDYIDFFSRKSCVHAGVMGVVGYCFAGGMALRTAAIRSDRIAAVASFHGARLFIEDPKSPHLVLPRVRAKLYFGHAVEDRTMPAESIARFEQALKAWGGNYTSEVYDGARHGWTVPDNPSYNRSQAEVAYGKMAALFRETLSPDL